MIRPTGSPAIEAASPGLDALCDELARLSPRLEGDLDWPATQFERLGAAGVLGWVVPQEYGGSGLPGPDLMQGYELLARSCLVTTFVLTQRNAACQRIAGAERDEARRELLPALCGADTFATVGISHLTTSRQHLRTPAVRVRATTGGYRLDGSVPWVTGARYADWLVTGGTCDDGRQILAVVPMKAAGVRVQEPPRLLALNASQTGSVELEQVEIDGRFVLAGPTAGVMGQGQGGGAGSLTTSALAIGHADAALQRLRHEAERRPDLVETCDALAAEHQALSADLQAAARGERDGPSGRLSNEAVRQRANSLVLRATQALMAASKGAGFVAGHPAERAVREAMFFLVWSCPQPVLAAALREFACAVEG